MLPGLLSFAALIALWATGVDRLGGWGDGATPLAPLPVVIGLAAITWLGARTRTGGARRAALLAGSLACAFAYDPLFAAGSLLWLGGLHVTLFAGGTAHPLRGLVYSLATLVALAFACNRDLWDVPKPLARCGFLFVIAYLFRITWLLHEVRMRRQTIPLVDVALYFLFAPLFVVVPYMLAIPRCDRVRVALDAHDRAIESSGIRFVAWGCALAVIAWASRTFVDPLGHEFAALEAHDLPRVVLYALPHYPIQPALDACAAGAIVVGLVRMFGVDLGVSFRRPLAAQTITEVWRRWNMHFRETLVELFYTPVVLRLRRTKRRAMVWGCVSVFVIGSTVFHLPKHYFRYGSLTPPDLHILVENAIMCAVVVFAMLREQTRPTPPATSRVRIALRVLRTWTLLLVIVIYAGYGSQYAIYGARPPVAITPWR